MSDLRFHVALGATAGGLGPLEAFCTALPADTGMAFIVVQHLMPASSSILPAMVQRHTQLPVHLPSKEDVTTRF